MADLRKTAEKILIFEGGFQQWVEDKGNYYKGKLIGTNKGVTPEAYFEVFKKEPTVERIKNLTFDEYVEVLRVKYWNKWRGEQIQNQQLADILVDWTYNSGSWGIKIPQRLLGVDDDGIVGSKTLKALNEADPKQLYLKIWNERKKFYENIVKNNPSQQRFLKGWMNRLNSFKWED